MSMLKNGFCQVSMNGRAWVGVLALAAFCTAGACASSDTPLGASGTGGSTGSGGGASATGGTIGTGGASGDTDPVASTGGSPGTGGADASDTGPITMPGTGGSGVARRHGKSPGCGMPAAMAGGQTLTIPKCMGCTAAMGNCPRDCIAPEFAPRAGGNVDFTTRSYTLQLPAGYDPNTAYPVFMGGSGCGGGGSGYGPPGDGAAIRVNLAIKNGGSLDGACFADGGQACSGNTTTLSYCVNSPEMAYVRGILSYLESHLCVDLDKEFIGGASSGAWEAYTLGCGDADQLRGFVALAGGKREHRWPCTGPIAAFMIADTGDGENPITTKSVEPHLDSHGSSAARDELLVRNGCGGNASTVFDPKYPSCLKYTGCPAAYPVVWCELNGGHVNTTQGGINYQNAIWSFFMSLPPPP
ncbi:MAG TPA: hypothetical protein VNO55_21735 [Polyangia bacterium]|nr:hypothetical protein [Polyangia bacterium]